MTDAREATELVPDERIEITASGITVDGKRLAPGRYHVKVPDGSEVTMDVVVSIALTLVPDTHGLRDGGPPA